MGVVGVYLPPSLRFAQFNQRLGQIEECIRRYAPVPTIVAGDFNVKSWQWGFPRTNNKDEVLKDWASLGLFCLNTDSTSTCVRKQGEIQWTWAHSSCCRKSEGGWSLKSTSPFQTTILRWYSGTPQPRCSGAANPDHRDGTCPNLTRRRQSWRSLCWKKMITRTRRRGLQKSKI